MIPYDDLVAGLAAWRARQGLPVSPAAPAAAPPRGPAPPPPPSARPAAPVAPAAPITAARPAVAPITAARPAVAPPPATIVHDDDLEDSAYDPDGGDFALALGGNAVESHEESTAIGMIPEPPRREKRNPDW